MTVRAKSVDFGPASLHVGEEWKASDPTSRPPDPDPGDVMRFRASAGARAPATAEAYDDRRAATPFELMETRAAYTGHASTLELGEVVACLWVDSGRAREVRIELHRDVLPDSSLVILEEAGRLQIRFKVSCDRTHRWMEATLPDLAEELGGRLSRPLRITLEHGTERERADVRVDWPEDGPR